MPEDEQKLVMVPEKLQPPSKFEEPEDNAFQRPEPSIAYLVLTEEQRKLLDEPIPLEDLDIRPTGEVFASQVQYRRRLNQVFGAGSWVLKEESSPRVSDNKIMQKWSLWAQGVFISVAWGDHEYFPNNRRTTWTDAWESAKSNALVRTCKDLGIASECWSRRFTSWFKKEHCIEVRTQDGRGWRLIDGDPLWNEIRQQPTLSPPAAPQQPKPNGGADAKPRSAETSPKAPRPKPAPPPSAEKINPDLARELQNKILSAGVEPSVICQQFQVESLEDLSPNNYDAVNKILDNRLLQMQKRGSGQLKFDAKN